MLGQPDQIRDERSTGEEKINQIARTIGECARSRTLCCMVCGLYRRPSPSTPCPSPASSSVTRMGRRRGVRPQYMCGSEPRMFVPVVLTVPSSGPASALP